ncbi:MAG: DUF262 domain-containing protein [Betaproteobacteria bacterium]|nr:DUF262 domain-containing protein [Candidatus Fonsibacter lacus]
MAKAEATVEELVGMIERGELRLPEMQRQYVWRSTRVRDLLDSLYRGYPSGAILLWETDEDVPLQAMAVGQQTNPYQTTRLLLDGQQRLTSLSAVIRGEPVNVYGRKRPIDILFNLEHPVEIIGVTDVNEESDEEPDQADASSDDLQQRFNQMTFVVSTKKLQSNPQWVKVSDVFKSSSNNQFLKRAGVTSLDDPKADLYQQRLDKLRAIKSYVYRMDILERALSYNEVTEIFVRVNSLGAKLRSSDLALAQITARWKNSLSTFQAFQAECRQVGFDFDLGTHLKNLVAMATGQSRFKSVSSLPLERLQTAWVEAKEGMNFALNFLRSNLGVDSPALLSSPSIAVAISYFGHTRNYQISPEESKLLRYWILSANAKGRYSRGSSETLLDQDIASIRDGGNIQNLIDRLRNQVGLLEIMPEELSGRNQRSALFKTMFLAFRSAGAKDWHSNLAISLDHSGAQHKLQFHHIFPKALLSKDGYQQREADDISNLAFIGGKTNRAISDKSPKEYLLSLADKIGKTELQAQQIPLEEWLLETKEYKAFLDARRKLIAARINAYLNQDDSLRG